MDVFSPIKRLPGGIEAIRLACFVNLREMSAFTEVKYFGHEIVLLFATQKQNAFGWQSQSISADGWISAHSLLRCLVDESILNSA